MFRFDHAFLKNLGLDSMQDEEQQSLLEHIYKELELRVGIRLSEEMSDELLNEFGKLDTNSPDALSWLKNTRPNFKEVIVEEQRKLRDEVLAEKDRILSSNQ